MPISIDITKARDIHKDNMRAARAPKLQELDVAFQRELEKGPDGDTAAIAAQKQALRDVTADPAIAAASTPEELKAAWDADLLGPAPY